MARPLKILSVAAEAHPFAKTGGLGDVCGALPLAHHRLGHDVRCVLPHYSSLTPALHRNGIENTGRTLSIPVGIANPQATLHLAHLQNRVPLYLIGNDFYFGRKGLYGEGGTDYPDNASRFSFFCRAALEWCKATRFQPDIIHCHDWQAGLVPAYLKLVYQDDPFFKNTRTLFTIHNLGYQGNFDASALSTVHLPADAFHSQGLEFHGRFSFLKAGLVYSNLLTTVSKRYRQEILLAENGFQMDGILRDRKENLYGVLNGVDYEEWNPENDPWIPAPFDSGNLKGKALCREALLKELRLKVPARQPLVAMVTRLSWQKGIDLVQKGFDQIMKEAVGLVLLGVGDPAYEAFFTEQAQRYAGRFACRLAFDEGLAHRIIAGSDLLLMPSVYEPCGLTQMYALRYGTVPVARSVGGLADTVKNFNPETGRGTGFNFRRFELKYLVQSLRKATGLFADRTQWRRLMQNGMSQNLSWKRAATEYIRLYRKTLRET
ncbi:Glycogen synthase [Nitrospina gracilis 3/211]|uniref:Glycogen synthase n=1 Tax=Nitrospina gracilis (strain 3/211) TaxID=1266370 RepID=M1Z0A2_NITG3|nr:MULTISPECIES: glycogen synthase GlgA [Nitrospina]MCF8724021.1 starch synthase [Nitrospina sp. Nb-3]CCQ91150.1 Glycogen synthase [Nitrospina gracilis 3/211]